MKRVHKILMIGSLILFGIPLSACTNLNQKIQNNISIKKASYNESSNLVDDSELSNNIRDSQENGMSYTNGVYTMTYTGGWLHSRTLRISPLIDQEEILYNGEVTDTKTLDVYYSATLKWNNSKSGRTAGIIIGRTALSNGENVYISADIVPYDKQVALYYYKKSGVEGDQYYKVPISGVAIADNFTYKLEVKRIDGVLSILINNKNIISLSSYSNDPNESTDPTFVETIDVNKIIPAIGVDFCDIDCELKDLTMQYSKPGSYDKVVYQYDELNEARESTNENIVELDELKMSANKRNSEPNGFSFSNGVAKMEYTGGWLRAANLFNNKYFNSNQLILNDDTLISTKGVNTYYKANFKVQRQDSDRVLGLIVGKTTCMNQTVYISVNVCPKNQYIGLYFFTSNPYDFTKQIVANFKIDNNVEYNFEVLIYNNRLMAFIDGKRYLDITSYDVSAYLHDEIQAHIEISSLTPTFGTNFMDIDAEIYNFEMKYLRDYKGIKYFEEPKYPTKDDDYTYNTEVPEFVVNRIDTAEFLDSMVVLYSGAILLIISVVAIVVFKIYIKKKEK